VEILYLRWEEKEYEWTAVEAADDRIVAAIVSITTVTPGIRSCNISNHSDPSAQSINLRV
jgi:hypothetical protein